ncbi:MAG: GtrA family protein [Pontiella sp.]
MQNLKKILLDKNHAGIQFIKYGLCGCTALTVDMMVAFLVAWLWLPALNGDELFVKWFGLQFEVVSEGIRTTHFIIGSIIAFLISNLVAYLLNVLFVFKAGKHSRRKELGMFYLVSGISVGIGVALGAALISWLGMPYDYSYIAKVISTTLINYVARKYLIFNG